MLELESGSNDPMAYVLVIALIEVIKAEAAPNYWMVGMQLVWQLAIGGAIGYSLGKLAVYFINKIKIGNDSLYPILVFTICLFIFSITDVLGGNSYLAVYISGLVIGNSKFVSKRSSLHFFDGLAWMSQLIMFLTLGLLVNPRELVSVIVPGLLISVIIIFIARPFAVHLCLLPFRKMPFADKAYISWVGLRGAVPIIFAIFPLAHNVPYADVIFNIVFFCTLISLLVQGTSLPIVAKWFGITEKHKELKKLKEFDVEFSDDIKSITAEIEISPEILSLGNQIMSLPLPEKTLVVMLKRDEQYFIPKGNTTLCPFDKLLIITNDVKTLDETYSNLGIK